MKKYSLLVYLFSLFLLSGNIPLQPQACYDQHCFELMLARTPEEQRQGLMFRDQLPPRAGMLFIYEEEQPLSFWMKNTLIPLDIIWLNKNKVVIYISKNTLPCKADPCPRIEPKEKSAYVLEINGGLSDEIGLKVGDQLALHHLEN